MDPHATSSAAPPPASGLVSRRTAVAGLALLLSGCRKPVPGRDRPLQVVFGPRHSPVNAELLRTRLERSSRLTLAFRLATSSDEAIDLVQSGKADAALLTLFDYFFCAGVFAVEPLVQVVRHGAVTQASELLVPAQSPVRELSELRGQRVGYVDRYSVTGFLLPAAHLGQARVAVEPTWLGTHDAVLAAVQEGKVAAGASYAGHAAAVTGLRVLATMAPIANEPVFVQRALPADVREALKGAWLAEQDPTSLQGLADATGFRDPPAQAFDEALGTLKAAGLQVEDTLAGGWLRANEHRRPAWSYGP